MIAGRGRRRDSRLHNSSPKRTTPANTIRLPVTNKGAAASIADLLKANEEDQMKAFRKIKKIAMSQQGLNTQVRRVQANNNALTATMNRVARIYDPFYRTTKLVASCALKK
ncbi:Uncharacterised protein [Chlamydia trachomatis]|nr:Uncharacterised protein [Chlamydia trachomatis]